MRAWVQIQSFLDSQWAAVRPYFDVREGLRWGQCLFHTLDCWHEIGGRACFRKSSHSEIAHAEHTNDESELSHFVPPADLKTPVHSLIGFYGEVLHHDMTPCKPMSIGGIVVSAFLLFWGAVLWAIWTILRNLFRSIP